MTVTDQSIYIGHLTLTGREVVAEESGRSGTDCGLQLWKCLFSTATGMEEKNHKDVKAQMLLWG